MKRMVSLLVLLLLVSPVITVLADPCDGLTWPYSLKDNNPNWKELLEQYINCLYSKLQGCNCNQTVINEFYVTNVTSITSVTEVYESYLTEEIHNHIIQIQQINSTQLDLLSVEISYLTSLINQIIMNVSVLQTDIDVLKVYVETVLEVKLNELYILVSELTVKIDSLQLQIEDLYCLLGEHELTISYLLDKISDLEQKQSVMLNRVFEDFWLIALLAVCCGLLLIRIVLVNRDFNKRVSKLEVLANEE